MGVSGFLSSINMHKYFSLFFQNGLTRLLLTSALAKHRVTAVSGAGDTILTVFFIYARAANHPAHRTLMQEFGGL